jgi:anti-sigma-K factor RskA
MTDAPLLPDRTPRSDLAIDHALGLTEGAERDRAERLLDTDAAFAAMVADWRRRLAGLDRTAAERAPSADLWPRIEQALDRPAPTRIAGPTEAASAVPAGFWQSLRFWRPAALAGAFLSLALAIGLIVLLLRGPTLPTYVAVLETDAGRPAAVVNVFADGTVTLVPLEPIGVPEGRILEVWTLQTRDRGPVSVGRMDRARTLRLNLRDLARPDAGHLFEITVEPPGGSPTGRPTGPVLMKGLAAQSL